MCPNCFGKIEKESSNWYGASARRVAGRLIVVLHYCVVYKLATSFSELGAFGRPKGQLENMHGECQVAYLMTPTCRGDDDRYRADDRYRRDEYDSPRRRRPSDVPVRRFSSGDYTSTVYRDRDDRR